MVLPKLMCCSECIESKICVGMIDNCVVVPLVNDRLLLASLLTSSPLIISIAPSVQFVTIAYTMFAAVAAFFTPRRTRSARSTRAASAAPAVPVAAAAPAILRPDRRTRTASTHEMSSNRVRFGFTEAKYFDKSERPVVVSEPSTIDVRPIINKRALKELEDSLDGAYWSRPVVAGRTRRAPIRFGNA